MPQNTAQKIKTTEKRILLVEEQIERSEELIAREEKKIEDHEKRIARNLHQLSYDALRERVITLRGFNYLRQVFLRKVGRRKLLFALFVTLGWVFVWRGVWHTIDEIPILNLSVVSLGIGVFIIWLLKEFTNPH